MILSRYLPPSRRPTGCPVTFPKMSHRLCPPAYRVGSRPRGLARRCSGGASPRRARARGVLARYMAPTPRGRRTSASLVKTLP